MRPGLPPLGLFLLLMLVIVWIYFRLRQRMKSGKLHGRGLWRAGAKRRHELRLDGARTWKERRRRVAAATPPRKIASRFLEKGSSEKSSADRDR